ncbi:MAG TPA: 16S rRNA (uracil(1498)-N(3))-methyltransferase [Galbitalea sp.]|jgi:16S rRNA (uracil1498-N3)-methyltransferase
MANLYLSEELGLPAIGDAVAVDGSEARHAVTVNRMTAGETVSVGNGAGVIATGTVTAVSSASFVFIVDAVETRERTVPSIWLAQALAKGDRDELAVQAATELGVDGVIPWSASRSISRWEGAKVAKGEERWRAIVREAAKQSARAWIPEVGPLTTTKQLSALAADAAVVVLDPLSQFALTSMRTGAAEHDTRDIVLVVGPEGGIAPNELELLYAAGATGAKLGESILRTSTAGPAAIAVLSAKLGRW